MPSPPSGTHGSPERGQSSVVEVWLRDERLSSAERLDRLAGDAELVDALRADGFQGSDWEFFVNELAKYGIAVVTGWMRRGVMAAKCAEKRIRVPTLPDWVRGDDQAVDDIATETVAEALNHFRDDVLVPGVWDPTKGAALKTFFIGQCMRRYANVARRWMDSAKPFHEVTTDDQEVLDVGHLTGVEDDAIRHLTAQRILEGVTNPRAARALAMNACGYSNEEIAADLGITRDAASSVLKRARAEIRQRQAGTGKDTG